MPPGHDMTIAAARRRDPVVRLVRLQPGLDAVGDGLRRHRPGRGQHDARGVRGRSRRRCSSPIPASHKWDTGITINGFLAGLVAITCPCYWVSPFGAICIGAIAGVVVVLGVDLARVAADRRPDRRGRGARLLRHLGHAQPRVCSPPASTACPAPTGADTSTPSKGLFYGGGCQQLGVQVIGSAVVTVGDVRRRAGRDVRVKALGVLRVSRRSTSSMVIDIPSTVRPRTTPSSRTWATRRSRAGKSTRRRRDARWRSGAADRSASAN